MAFTVIAILTVDKFGRKPLQIIGAIGMALSMTGLGLVFYFESMGMGALIFMLLYVASFAMSWGPVTWVLLSEIFPNSIKGAMSIAGDSSVGDSIWLWAVNALAHQGAIEDVVC